MQSPEKFKEFIVWSFLFRLEELGGERWKQRAESWFEVLVRLVTYYTERDSELAKSLPLVYRFDREKLATEKGTKYVNELMPTGDNLVEIPLMGGGAFRFGLLERWLDGKMLIVETTMAHRDGQLRDFPTLILPSVSVYPDTAVLKDEEGIYYLKGGVSPEGRHQAWRRLMERMAMFDPQRDIDFEKMDEYRSPAQEAIPRAWGVRK